MEQISSEECIHRKNLYFRTMSGINRREFLGWILILVTFRKRTNKTLKSEVSPSIVVVDHWFLLEKDLKMSKHKRNGEWIS